MPSLYILKAICAILIVFIHLPGIWHEAIFLQPLMRIGVPTFLMISGYFLVTGNRIDIHKVSRQLPKIFRLTIWVYLVYFAFMVIRNILLGLPAINAKWLTPEYLVRMIFIGDNVDSILWYMTAYIETLIILWILLKSITWQKVRTILGILTPILLVSAIIFNRYSILLGRDFDIAISRNALTVGLPCVFLGSLVRINTDRLSNVNKPLILTAGCLLFAYIEYALLHKFDINGSGADFNIMTFPLAFCIFSACVRWPDIQIGSGIIKRGLVFIGRNNSSDIYLFHSLVWLILSLMILLTGYNELNVIANAEAIIIIVLIYSLTKFTIKNSWTSVKLKL